MFMVADLVSLTNTYVVGTQNNCLNEMVLLSTPQKWESWWLRKCSQFYAKFCCLSVPMIPLNIDWNKEKFWAKNWEYFFIHQF